MCGGRRGNERHSYGRVGAGLGRRKNGRKRVVRLVWGAAFVGGTSVVEVLVC